MLSLYLSSCPYMSMKSETLDMLIGLGSLELSAERRICHCRHLSPFALSFDVHSHLKWATLTWEPALDGMLVHAFMLSHCL